MIEAGLRGGDEAARPPSAGDPTGWLDEHGDALFAFAVRRVGRRELAEDLVQETLLSALRTRGRFRGRATVRTWLISILRRRIADHYRNGPSTTEPAASPFGPDGIWRIAVPDWETPETAAEGVELRDVLEACISDLPESLALPFALRELEGRAPEEICGTLGLSRGNLRVRLHRARLLLRGCLGRRWFGERPVDEGDAPR